MSQLSPEILVDILSRLPVKPLLRFRSVSTSCSDFINLHLTRSIQTKTNLPLILGENTHFSAIDFDPLDPSSDPETLYLDDPLLSYSKLEHVYFQVWGSLNGLIFLSVSNYQQNHLFLWNPSTRRSMKLPPPPYEHSGWREEHSAYGFGYDSIGDGYKVVRIVGRPSTHCVYDNVIEVYNTKSNSWRMVDKSSYCKYLKLNKGILSNGALHWWSCKTSNYSKAGHIVAFDLGSEKFRLLPQPEYSDRECPFCIDSLGGCLSIISKVSRQPLIWVMKEYGVKESWTKLILVTDPIPGHILYLVPIDYSKDGARVLMRNSSDLVFSFDLEKLSLKIHPVSGMEHFTVTCLRSLVPLSAADEGISNSNKRQRKQKMSSSQLNNEGGCLSRKRSKTAK